jgi:hypothetical protein
MADILTIPAVLTSLEQALEPLGKPCPDCEAGGGPFGYRTEGIIYGITREGNKIRYFCDSRMPHRIGEASVLFSASDEEIKKAGAELREVMLKARGKKGYEFRDVEHEVNRAITKMKNYALFAPANRKIEFPGLCTYCYGDIGLSIQKRQLWFGCSTCASILADGAD